ncbi:hypothetical protein [Rhizobium etli]|uniref:hypothetical protein n=1 Tax=Rhizobium etli TaxID=29449 RepID=UPI0012BB51EB|nr:hypothetical protein [Rhizobium etli]
MLVIVAPAVLPVGSSGFGVRLMERYLRERIAPTIASIVSIQLQMPQLSPLAETETGSGCHRCPFVHL